MSETRRDAGRRRNGAVAIIMSACLAGEPVRYDGRDNRQTGADWNWVRRRCRILSVCPEIFGGLPVPRSPAEIRGGNGEDVLDGTAAVVTRRGEDVTSAFVAGARKTLRLAEENAVRVAVLAERSPSCGSSVIYSGHFNRVRIPGEGVTTALLRRHGIRVFSQYQPEELIRFLDDD